MEGNLLELQVDCTGSDVLWSDITILKTLTLSDVVTFAQWPSFLGKQNWKDIVHVGGVAPDFNSLTLRQVMTTTILHELMHSIAITTPISIPPLLIYLVFSLNANY